MSGGLLTEARVRLPAGQPGATLGESVRAAAEEAFISSPMSSMLRSNELEAGYLFGQPVDAETARARIRDEGLEGHLTVGDQGISDLALDTLITRKKEELARQQAIASGPQGFIPGAARFAGAFGGSLMDPLNVASAFVPVVGPAKYTAMLAKASGVAGRAGVRAGVGAVEGAVGAAVLEPFIL